MVGGVAAVAHHAGKKSGQAAAAEQNQDAQTADLQAEQAQPQAAPAQAAPATTAGSTDMVTQLENLKKLLDEGVLTQAEFDMEKQKLLASS